MTAVMSIPQPLQQESLFDAWLEEPDPEPERVETSPAPVAIPQPVSPTREEALATVAVLRETGPPAVWEGDERLRDHLRPIAEVEGLVEPEERDDIDQFVEALERFGQVRPILISTEGAVISRGYLVTAALRLGWSHIAVRLEIAERSVVSPDQTSLMEEVERNVAQNGSGISQHDLAAIESLAVRDPLAGLTEDEVGALNATTVDPAAEWVGLPEFLPVGEPLKIVVSCDSEDDRDALFSLLGIRTIHKGTRGTLSVWWPDRAKEDLSSLRFVVEEPEPETFEEEPEPWF